MADRFSQFSLAFIGALWHWPDGLGMMPVAMTVRRAKDHSVPWKRFTTARMKLLTF
jgi:hypothetical protein